MDENIEQIKEDSADKIEIKENEEEEHKWIVGRSIKTQVLEKINSGSYGEIHLGIFLSTNEKVAVKLECMKTPNPQLLSEGNIMRHLENGPGIPKIYWFGSYEPDYNVMVMDLLGPNVQELFTFCGHIFTLKTVLLLADQMLDTLDFIHKKEYVHRDIKPDNFAIGQLGTDRESKIYILDFGLAKKYQRQRFSVSAGIGSGYGLARPMVGTVRYMGLHAHDGQGDQPRDDLESLVYVMIYFLKGRLPWQGIKGCKNREEKLAQIRKAKTSISPEALCKDLPPLFADFLDKCRRAKVHDATTCAAKWRKYLRVFAEDSGIEFDYQYDWVVKQRETGVSYSVLGKSSKNHGHNSS